MLALTRRTLAVGLLTIFLAACKVVPDTRPDPAPAKAAKGQPNKAEAKAAPDKKAAAKKPAAKK